MKNQNITGINLQKLKINNNFMKTNHNFNRLQNNSFLSKDRVIPKDQKMQTFTNL